MFKSSKIVTPVPEEDSEKMQKYIQDRRVIGVRPSPPLLLLTIRYAPR